MDLPQASPRCWASAVDPRACRALPSWEPLTHSEMRQNSTFCCQPTPRPPTGETAPCPPPHTLGPAPGLRPQGPPAPCHPPCPHLPPPPPASSPSFHVCVGLCARVCACETVESAVSSPRPCVRPLPTAQVHVGAPLQKHLPPKAAAHLWAARLPRSWARFDGWGRQGVGGVWAGESGARLGPRPPLAGAVAALGAAGGGAGPGQGSDSCPVFCTPDESSEEEDEDDEPEEDEAAGGYRLGARERALSPGLEESGLGLLARFAASALPSPTVGPSLSVVQLEAKQKARKKEERQSLMGESRRWAVWRRVPLPGLQEGLKRRTGTPGLGRAWVDGPGDGGLPGLPLPGEGSPELCPDLHWRCSQQTGPQAPRGSSGVCRGLGSARWGLWEPTGGPWPSPGVRETAAGWRHPG